jgi:hypothetical protein
MTITDLANQYPGRLLVEEDGTEWDLSHFEGGLDPQYEEAGIYTLPAGEGILGVYFERGDVYIGDLYTERSPDE